VREAQGRRREAGSERRVDDKREPMNKNRMMRPMVWGEVLRRQRASPQAKISSGNPCALVAPQLDGVVVLGIDLDVLGFEPQRTAFVLILVNIDGDACDSDQRLALLICRSAGEVLQAMNHGRGLA
jgi:hypothetical protein